ncbi:hypothetical protein EC973_003780 [Apophysomyces ossiformis]|uniref:Uncharacterized protein n=1 Tax=Apophysomyces ossiformis TaxID=679940 RepID=A0A8H7BGT8_9FUNG|nr:hypothetical protein EC973_003780 [Apophysomyces ossiformis]
MPQQNIKGNTVNIFYNYRAGPGHGRGAREGRRRVGRRQRQRQQQQEQQEEEGQPMSVDEAALQELR